jgi:ABC-2 type transport system ATP-binding protein
MTSVLSVDQLSKWYGPRLAVDAVSFNVRQHEVFGLLGPNGSGKSTILRLVTGYLSPTAGSVRVAGIDVAGDGRAARRHIGYVSENAPLYGDMRVAELLAFMGRLRGLSGTKLDRAVDAAVERLALSSVRNVIIERLSHGFRQRVSIAQAVLHEPALLVLDEPTNGLDPRQIIELRGLIRHLAQRCTVVITSHVLSEIERMADRVAILLDGRLLTVEAIPRQENIAPPASRLETLFLELTKAKAMQ